MDDYTAKTIKKQQTQKRSCNLSHICDNCLSTPVSPFISDNVVKMLKRSPTKDVAKEMSMTQFYIHDRNQDGWPRPSGAASAGRATGQQPEWGWRAPSRGPLPPADPPHGTAAVGSPLGPGVHGQRSPSVSTDVGSWRRLGFPFAGVMHFYSIGNYYHYGFFFGCEMAFAN